MSRKLLRSFASIVGVCICSILYFKPFNHTLSNAFETSLRTTQHCFLSAIAFDIVSVIVARAVSVDLFLRKPCCVVGRILFDSRKVRSLLFINFSYILPGTSSNDMGRKLLGSVVGLSGFGVLLVRV